MNSSNNKPTLKPISDTAFYCCGTRKQDAESKKPLCNDQFAKVFMTDYGQRIFNRFKIELIANSACVVRHHIIDELIRKKLIEEPNLQIIIIGAGFDTRAYRMLGGSWIECDEEQIIQFKNQHLPISDCPNPLQRLSIDFSSKTLEQVLLKHPSNKPVMVILEGVSMYLGETEIVELIAVLQRCYPQHELACDLVTKKFIRYFGATMERKIKRLGSAFKKMDDPASIFLNNNYKTISTTSIVVSFAQHHLKTTKTHKIPAFLLNKLPSVINNGYAIHHFKTKS